MVTAQGRFMRKGVKNRRRGSLYRSRVPCANFRIRIPSFPVKRYALISRAMTPKLDRRSFIVTPGVAARACTRVLGANDAIRVGINGAGGRMGDLMNSADKVATYQIAAVSDVYAPRRDAVKQRANANSATTRNDYRELL